MRLRRSAPASYTSILLDGVHLSPAGTAKLLGNRPVLLRRGLGRLPLSGADPNRHPLLAALSSVASPSAFIPP